MCLAAFSLQPAAEYRLVFAANRDELHERPTAPAGWWDDHDAILGGRDLVAGGSWLAVDRSGRLAAVTNFREDPRVIYPRSRGQLVQNYLTSAIDAAAYLATVKESELEYGPFNLVIFDGHKLFYASNRAASRELDSGIYAVSNTHFDTPWPKVTHARSELKRCLNRSEPSSCLFDLLTDETLHGDRSDTADRASRLMSTVFIKDETYGTRSSTVILLSQDGELSFSERRFGANGIPLGESTEAFAIRIPV